MFEDMSLAATVLMNPAAVQSLVLTEFQNRLNGVYSVADPNNSFNLLLEASSSMNAQSVRLMESQLAAQYAVRATTAAELYNNMSDFDYLNMVAGPAQTTLNLTFDVDYLIANALAYDTTYNRIVIPVSSQFYIGPLTFGIYYPITININRVTNNINVLWDTTTPNPLHLLKTNMVPFVQYSNGGLNLITLTVPVTQFATATTLHPVVSQQGFVTAIGYTDQFYAVRVFTNLPAGNWTELAYTLSETVYDPTTPTAKIVIQNDVNLLNINIPQIYFTNNQIGNQVMVMIYTTKGAITLDLTSVEVSSYNCNFNIGGPNVTPYSAILANMATIDLTPAETTITGGSTALSFSELRKLVINGGLYTGVPVTPSQLVAYAAKKGFSITKYTDNVTNRIYYASNTIQGGQNGYVMTTTGTIAITPGDSETTSTILNFTNDNAITILPTTTYSYNPQTNSCMPLTDTQVAVLQNMTKAAFATEVNTNTYTKCPFHLVTYIGSQYPITKSFNLMNPKVTAIRFIEDNVFLTPQMSCISSVVLHNANGTGGYTLRLGVTKTPAMSEISESDITVYISGVATNDDVFYGIATMMGTSGALTIYELTIPSTYYISQNGAFRSTMPVINQTIGSTTVDISLETTFDVTFFIPQTLYPAVAQNVNLIPNVASPYNTLLGVCRQQLDVVFGTDLSSQIFNATNALWSSVSYATHPATVYLTYPNDVYETNSQGGLVYTVSGSTLQLNKIHNKGDQILDSTGSPIIRYAAGSVRLDAIGNPIVMGPRRLNYYTTCLMFDLRLFHSENQRDTAFVAGLTGTLAGHLDTLALVQSNLLEQTSLFYMPNNTMGTATFSSGDNVPISLNLGFRFWYTAYVSQATLDNPTLKAAIISDITAITQTEMTKSVISLTDIAQTIKTILSDTIVSIDVEGIDRNRLLQTVIVPAGVTAPIVAQELVYDPDNSTLSLQPAITVTFVLAS